MIRVGIVGRGRISLSLPLLIWYPITKVSHAQLRARLAETGGQEGG